MPAGARAAARRPAERRKSKDSRPVHRRGLSLNSRRGWPAGAGFLWINPLSPSMASREGRGQLRPGAIRRAWRGFRRQSALSVESCNRAELGRNYFRPTVELPSVSDCSSRRSGGCAPSGDRENTLRSTPAGGRGGRGASPRSPGGRSCSGRSAAIAPPSALAARPCAREPCFACGGSGRPGSASGAGRAGRAPRRCPCSRTGPPCRRKRASGREPAPQLARPPCSPARFAILFLR